MSMVADILAVLDAGGHVMGHQHVAYHPARKARDAARIKDPISRMRAIRQAVAAFRVRAEVPSDASYRARISTMDRSSEVTL